MKLLAILLLWAACSSKSDPTSRREEPAKPDGQITREDPRDHPPFKIEYRRKCNDVTAVWRGMREYGEDYYNEISFEIPGTKGPVHLKDLKLELNIFSPDCRHVLLLPDVYHIVRVDRLAAYAAGAPPDYVLAGKPDPKGEYGTGVFRDGRWISNGEVQYDWGCCDPPTTSRFVLPK